MASLGCGISYNWRRMLPGFNERQRLLALRRLRFELPVLASAWVPVLAFIVIAGVYVVLLRDNVGITGLLLAAGVAFGLHAIRNGRIRREMKAIAADPSACGQCGYPLHGLDSPHCPECGAATGM